MEVNPEPYVVFAILGMGFFRVPYISRIHTAYIGEDSSILSTWNVWWCFWTPRILKNNRRVVVFVMYHGRVGVFFPCFFSKSNFWRDRFGIGGDRRFFPLNRGGESRIWESLNQMPNQSTEGGWTSDHNGKTSLVCEPFRLQASLIK